MNLGGVFLYPDRAGVERRADQRVVLDERFIPTVMDARAAPVLATFMTELQGLLHQRGEALAGRIRHRPWWRRRNCRFFDFADNQQIRTRDDAYGQRRSRASGRPLPPVHCGGR